jgi:hypothetical protein
MSLYIVAGPVMMEWLVPFLSMWAARFGMYESATSFLINVQKGKLKLHEEFILDIVLVNLESVVGRYIHTSDKNLKTNHTDMYF